MSIKIKYLFFVLFFSVGGLCFGIDSEAGKLLVGEDLYLKGARVLSYQTSTSEHSLVFDSGFLMHIGGNRLSSSKGVVLLESLTTESRGRVSVDYIARVYLEGSVEAGETPNYRVLTLENGWVTFNLKDYSPSTYTLSVTGGDYQLVSRDTSEWEVGWTVTPVLYCQIVQRGE